MKKLGQRWYGEVCVCVCDGAGWEVGGVNLVVVIAGVTARAALRWPRKRPALLDRPISIVAAPR